MGSSTLKTPSWPSNNPKCSPNKYFRKLPANLPHGYACPSITPSSNVSSWKSIHSNLNYSHPQSTHLNNEGDLRVSFADQRAIVDVGRTANHHFVVDDHQFWVHVNQFGDWFWVETRVRSEPVEADVLRRVGDSRFFQSVQNCVLAAAKHQNSFIKTTFFSFDFLKMFDYPIFNFFLAFILFDMLFSVLSVYICFRSYF